MLLTILIVLLILALLGGGLGYQRGYGHVSMGPVVLIIIILLVLYLTGSLR